MGPESEEDFLDLEDSSEEEDHLQAEPPGPSRTMSDLKTSLKKLGDSNYAVWKFRMELVLIQENLYGVVSEEKPRHPDAVWKAKDAKARALIGLSVEDGQLCHIIRAGSSKEMWDGLKAYHERSSLASKVHVLRKLCSQRLREGGNMSDHLNDVTNLTNRLTAMGEELKEHWIVAMLLSSLPESYNSLITALESRPEEDLTLEYVKGKLLDEWRRRVENQAEEKALRTGSASSMVSSEKSKITCHYCQKEGHFRRDCKKMAKDRKSQDKRSREPEQKVKMVKNKASEVCFAAGDHSAERGLWFLDSGATSHMTNNRSLLGELDTSCKDSISLADGNEVQANGVGAGTYRSVDDEGQPVNVKLKGVYYVPALTGNLLSVSKIADEGFTVLFEKNGCKIMKDGAVKVVGERRGGLYFLKPSPEKSMMTTVGHTKECIHLWHRRLGHRNTEAISRIVREQLGTGISFQKCDVKTVCESCCEGKMARKSFPKVAERRSKAVGDLVHTDLSGPFEVPTPSGNRYSMVLVDDYSRYTVVYLLQCKSEAFERIQQYTSMIETQFGRKPKVLRSDGGGEYSSGKLRKFLADNGILLQQSAPYSPQQNGAAERKNRSLAEMMRCLLADAGMEKKFWGEAMMTACYLQNLLPTAPTEKTPYEMWHDRKPSYKHLRVFGSTAFVYIPKQQRRKLDKKANKMVLVGYAEGQKAYRFLNPVTCSITISRDAKFDEGRFDEGEKADDSVSCYTDDEDEIAVTLRDQAADGPHDDEDEEEYSGEEELEYDSVPDDQSDSNSITAESEFEGFPDEVAPRRSQRATKGIPPKRLIINSWSAEVSHAQEEPKNYTQAMAGPDREQWHAAMVEELNSITSNKTWTLVDLPAGRKAVGSKWVYKIKRDAEGEVARYKARLVAQGFSQQYGTDYDQVFAPVVRQTTFRTLLAVAAKQGMAVRQFDVKTAFLYGTLDEEIYLRQPPGFVVQGEERKVYKLRKSLYGLKQAARSWNSTLHSELERLGFRRCDSDPCLYRKKENNRWCYVLVYVDDLIVACQDQQTIDRFIGALQKKFSINSLGDVHWYLGIEVKRDEDGDYFINQRQYINEIVRSCGLEDAKDSKIPLDPGYWKLDAGTLLPNNNEYQKLIGQLLYVSVNSRPDISAAVSILSRKTSNPSQSDWQELKRVARYLKGTSEYWLRLSDNSQQAGLVGYSDADWAECKQDRKSNSGLVIQFNGGTISWACRKQSCVSLSTAEAEFVALTEATQEMLWVKRLLGDFGEAQDYPVLYEDNQSTLKMLDVGKFSNRTKHIATKFHFIRDIKASNQVRFAYCPTEDMTADLLTKPLGGTRLAKLRTMCGLELQH